MQTSGAPVYLPASSFFTHPILTTMNDTLNESETTKSLMQIEFFLASIERKAKTAISNEWADDFRDAFARLQSIVDATLQGSIHADIQTMLSLSVA